MPKSRLFLFEHFGNTTAGTNWGRSGVSAVGWRNAIKARSQAAHDPAFAGFVSGHLATQILHRAELGGRLTSVLLTAERNVFALTGSKATVRSSI